MSVIPVHMYMYKYVFLCVELWDWRREWPEPMITTPNLNSHFSPLLHMFYFLRCSFLYSSNVYMLFSVSMCAFLHMFSCVHVRVCVVGFLRRRWISHLFGPQPVQVNNTFTHHWAHYRSPTHTTSPPSLVHHWSHTNPSFLFSSLLLKMPA